MRPRTWASRLGPRPLSRRRLASLATRRPSSRHEGRERCRRYHRLPAACRSARRRIPEKTESLSDSGCGPPRHDDALYSPTARHAAPGYVGAPSHIGDPCLVFSPSFSMPLAHQWARVSPAIRLPRDQITPGGYFMRLQFSSLRGLAPLGVAACLLGMPALARSPVPLTEEEANSIAVDAYVYFYPLCRWT